MEKQKIFEKIKQRFSSVDLDNDVHELKAQEAAMINNAGINYQLEYLYKEAGLDWLIETFLE